MTDPVGRLLPHDDVDDRLERMLESAPCTWGRWGDADEIGALNYLDADQVCSARDLVRRGAVFTLATEAATSAGDAVFPGRWAPRRYSVVDYSSFASGTWSRMPGGLAYADDYVTGFAQLGTHCDALGHMWCGSQIWNGYHASTTTGLMRKAGIVPIARHGIVGRALVVDIARHLGVEHLERAQEITLEDVLAAIDAQGCRLQPRTILLLRTGWLGHVLAHPEVIDAGYWEPGLSYSEELAWWFHDNQIPCLSTDTLANECTFQPSTGIQLPLHAALMSRLGVAFVEVADLEALAADCADDGRYELMYAASPVPIQGGTGGSLNPIAIK